MFCMPRQPWSTLTYNGGLTPLHRGAARDHACKFEVIIELYRSAACVDTDLPIETGPVAIS